MFLALLAMLWRPPQIQAATINVDSGCSLAQAINEANGWTQNVGGCEAGTDAGGGNPGEDTIVLSANITLTSNLPVIITNITIDGSDSSGGRYTISGGGQYRVIYHDHGDLALQNLILANGRTKQIHGAVYSDSGFEDPLTIHNSRIINSDLSSVAGSKGAGVYKEGAGKLTITETVITGNKAAQEGGGIWSESPTSISRSAIYSNSARSGGAVYVTGEDSSLAITNSTLYSNTASSAGGGVYAGPVESVALKHVTIVKNGAAADSAGGIYLTSGGANINVRNNILYDNRNGDCKLTPDESFTGTSGGVVVKDNIIGANSCAGINLAGNPNPELASSATGDIPYFPFSTTSPAKDAADCLDDVTVDQIGTTRPQPQGGKCDIGAYEGAGAFTLATATPTNTPTATPANTAASTPTATATSTPTATATSTPTPTATSTPTPTSTSTPTNTPPLADTPAPTDTPMPKRQQQRSDNGDSQPSATPSQLCEQFGPKELWYEAIPLGAIACIFRGRGQFQVYGIDERSRGFFMTSATQEQVDAIGAGLVAASADGRAAIFVVGAGDIIVSVGPDFEGKIAHMRFEGGLFGGSQGVYTTYGGPPGLAAVKTDDQQMPNRAVNHCIVTTTGYINFRYAPGGAILEVLPRLVTLTAVERTDKWFKVDWYGTKGWVSAYHVVPRGDCD